MATANSAGTDYTVPPNVKGSGASNNHGAATRIGSSSTNFDNVSVSRSQTEVFGSTVIDGTDTNEALSASVIAYNNNRPVGMRVSSTVSGQSNTALLSGASVPGLTRSIHKRESFKVYKIATAIRAGYWNIYSGTWSTTPTSTTESPGNDDAASVTRAAPGELVFMSSGAKLERSRDYAAKTG